MTTADGQVIGATQISGSAPRNRAFNVVVLADGFTAAQQDQFNSVAADFVAALLGTPPFDELTPAINVFRVNVSSTDDGADDPAGSGGSGAVRRTYFDASFGANGIQRLLVCNNTTALQVAATQVPEFSLAIVAVNSVIYGGSGGSVATFSLASGATEIAIHESGHTAFGLADEYSVYAGGNETGHDHHPPEEPREPNVTVNADRSTSKWGWAIAPPTAVPTMSNPECATEDTRSSTVATGVVGLFEGAHYFHCGAFRAEFNCKMRALSMPFCVACRQAIRNRIGPLVTLPARHSTPITALARRPDHLDTFAVADDGRTMTDWSQANFGWSGWSQVSGGLASSGGRGSPVTALARTAEHLDVFMVGTDDGVYSASWDVTSGWSPWVRRGSVVCRPGSAVTALARRPDHLDLFTTRSDGAVVSTWWDASGGWAADWFGVSGGVAAPGATVTAVARAADHLDLFTIGPDNRVGSVWWDSATGWADWFSIGMTVCRPDATVAVVARHPRHLDLFTTRSDGGIVSTWWDASGGWADWFQVSGGFASAGSSVTAVARRADHLDLFTVGPDALVQSTWWDASGGWAGWFNVSGGIGYPGAAVAAVARTPDHLDLFTVGPDALVQSTWWDASGRWATWFPLGVS